MAYERQAIAKLIERLRKGGGGPFLNRLDANPQSAHCWQWVSEVISAGNPVYYAAFMRSFYDNADPHVSLLRKIQCPSS